MKAKIMVVLAPSQRERLRKLLAGQHGVFLVPNLQEAGTQRAGCV